MNQIQFPKIEYGPPIARNIDMVFTEQRTFGQKAADWVAIMVGSWHFILIQSLLMALWIVLNITGLVLRWDPYPFILLNLLLSTQAAFTAPIIMMSQNRQAARDRLENHLDYQTDSKAEQEIRMILEQIEAQNQALLQIHQMLAEIAAVKKDTPS